MVNDGTDDWQCGAWVDVACGCIESVLSLVCQLNTVGHSVTGKASNDAWLVDNKSKNWLM